MSKPAAKSAPDPITPGEQRIELQLEGLRSVVSGGFLALSQPISRIEALLERMAIAIERQNQLLIGANGHARADAHPND